MKMTDPVSAFQLRYHHQSRYRFNTNIPLRSISYAVRNALGVNENDCMTLEAFQMQYHDQLMSHFNTYKDHFSSIDRLYRRS